jgi:oxygen-independent coproporphyrinogen-3 oxidase
MAMKSIDTSTLSFQELSEILDNLYLSDPRLRPNPSMHDYQLTYPPAVLIESAPVKHTPTHDQYQKHALGRLRNLALYFHFGFCEYKCRYCHHYEIKTTAKEAQMSAYVDTMIQEMLNFASRTTHCRNLIYFLGGGTPTSLPAHLIKKFLLALDAYFGKPISAMSTVEIKPVTASDEKLRLFVEHGFQRINLGVQTLDPELYTLHHHGEHLDVSLDAIDRARRAGYRFINIDILTGIESQTLDAWNRTLQTIEELIKRDKIDSVFIYPYHDDPRSKTFRNAAALPSTKEVMYSEVLARKMFERLGWTELGTRFFRSPRHRRQELKDFMRSRANPSYGELVYHGFGNSAFSVGDSASYINHRSIDDYRQAVETTGLGISNWLVLDDAQRATRDLTFDLLYSPIVRVRSIAKKYGKASMAAHIQQLEQWAELGLGRWNPVLGIWRLSKLGKLLHQQMIAALYLEKESLALNEFMTQRLELGRAYRGY